MNGVTLITPTGGRPDAFRLCERWMARQTYTGPLQWVVVDDADPVTSATMGQDVLRPEPKWNGSHTLARNIRAGLGAAKYDAVIVIEDDDWYSPEYVRTTVDRLETLPAMRLCGECPSRYYNVATRCYRLPGNMNHASLCQTAFRLELVPRVLGFMTSDPWVDLMLWSKIPGTLHEGYNVVGIKGLPGRTGVGIGHHPGGTPDPELTVLRSWVGENDAWEYAQWAT
jgi:hypothetical protein